MIIGEPYEWRLDYTGAFKEGIRTVDWPNGCFLDLVTETHEELLPSMWITRDFIDTDIRDIRASGDGVIELLADKVRTYGAAYGEAVRDKFQFSNDSVLIQLHPLKLTNCGIITDGVTHRIVFDYGMYFKEPS